MNVSKIDLNSRSCNARSFNSIEDVKCAMAGFNMQLQPCEVLEIIHTLKTSNCKLLVFGLGFDSQFWFEVNSGGCTVFLEDNATWFNNIKKAHPVLQAYLVNYNTRLNDWGQLIGNDECLSLEVPKTIRSIQWDVVLVDGPCGYAPTTTGRMKSIFMAAKLGRPSGHVFVHDAERQVESIFCDHYLGEENCVGRTWGRALLKHYVLPVNGKKCIK